VSNATSVLPLLCQTHPRLKSKCPYWPDDSETDSLDGYQNVGRKWNSSLFEANRITGRKFQWLVNLNFTKPIRVETLIQRKAKLMKELGREKNLALFWRLQINEENRRLCHFHFAVLDEFSDNAHHLTRVFAKAIKPFATEVRLYVKPMENQYRCIPYINKTRDQDRNKIVLFAKGLSPFTKIGVLHYPWPKEWEKLPHLSKKSKGGRRQRHQKHRKIVARKEAERIWCRGIDHTFQKYLRDHLKLSRYHLRKMLVSDLDHWENECENWYKTPEARKYLEAEAARAREAQAELDRHIEKKSQAGESHQALDPIESLPVESKPTSAVRSRIFMGPKKPLRQPFIAPRGHWIPSPMGFKSTVSSRVSWRLDLRLPLPRSP